MHRFAGAIVTADQLVAIANTVKFRYDDGTTFLNWEIGENVDHAVWISVFLVLVIIVNMFPARVGTRFRREIGSCSYCTDVGTTQVFGELDYVFGCMKLTFITMLIVMMLILNTMQRGYWSCQFAYAILT
jgi:amino acid transporter